MEQDGEKSLANLSPEMEKVTLMTMQTTSTMSNSIKHSIDDGSNILWHTSLSSFFS